MSMVQRPFRHAETTTTAFDPDNDEKSESCGGVKKRRKTKVLLVAGYDHDYYTTRGR